MPTTRPASIAESFHNYGQQLLLTFEGFVGITRFAALLTDKANALVQEAKLDATVEIASLEKELYKIGTDLIKEYAVRFKKTDRPQMDIY